MHAILLTAMDVIWHGKTCFTLKGKKATVVLDPFLDGQKLNLKGDFTLLTSEEMKPTSVDGQRKTFSWPGEYEADDTHIHGFQAWDVSKSKEEKGEQAHKVTVFKIEADGFKICHLGSLGHQLTDQLIEEIGDVDILFVPIGGKHCLDSKKAHEVIEEIDPRVVIPMQYDSLDEFAKEVGLREHKAIEKYSIQVASALPQDHTEYVILEIQN